MLKSLQIKKFTVFEEANFTFGRNLNIIVGENGTGKTHILKAAYSAIAVSAANSTTGERVDWEVDLARKLHGVFGPDRLGGLVRHGKSKGKCELDFEFEDSALNIKVAFSATADATVTLVRFPKDRVKQPPVFLPTRELLSIYPGFVSLYQSAHVPFEETWRDTCLLLGKPLVRGQRVEGIVKPLEVAMGGKIELDQSGRFYLSTGEGKSNRLEIHLVAEGLRKIATVAQLVLNGSLHCSASVFPKGYLFWDEPESNLNPKIVKAVAKTILAVASSGIQVFVATHSLFLLRELHILQRQSPTAIDTRCFGLHFAGVRGVDVQQGSTMDDIGDIASLDEDLQQSERYIDTEMGLKIQIKDEPGRGMTLNIDGLNFDFIAPVRAEQYDRWVHYREVFQAHDGGKKAVDVVAADPHTCWLIEVKDYDRPDTGPPTPTKLSDLPQTVATKVTDTLHGLRDARMRATQTDEREFADRALTATRRRIVLHLEENTGLHTALFPPDQSVTASIFQKLRQLVKDIDPHPLVLNITTTQRSDVPWLASRPVLT